jgi:hypothetical protein
MSSGRIYEEGDPPAFFIDLLELEDYKLKIFKVIGFVPEWPFPEAAEGALFGIALKRGLKPNYWPITTSKAKQMLGKFPKVELKFREEFPSIILENIE